MPDPAAAPESLPLVTLLYGDDHLALHDRVDNLTACMSDPTMADMNIARLDGAGQNTSVDDVRTAAFTLPFLAARRLVIVENPAALVRSESANQKLLDMLDNLPGSTALILVQDDVWLTEKNKRGWKFMYDYRDGKKHKIQPLLAWARSAGRKVKIEIRKLPALNAMPGWIALETKRQGGEINPRAAAALAAITGSETGVARQEITKLLTYVDFQRPIEPEDVEDLAAPGGQADVFVMVEALAGGDSQQALRHLHRLLEQQDPQSLFAMVIWQYRLIIMAREAYESGITSEAGMTKRLEVHSLPAGKALTLCKRYDMASLHRIYHHLLEIDRKSKTSQMELEAALQTFIAEMGRPL